MRRSDVGGAIAIATAMACLVFSGCTYMCHDYNLVEPVVEGGAWRVFGNVYRFHPEGWESAPGNWDHWSARDDDRYQLRLVPVAADTAFWVDGDVDLVDARVVAGTDTISIRWAEVVDLVETTKDRIGPLGRPQPHRIEYGKRSFTSDYFFLIRPVPDTLSIEFELRLLDAASRTVMDTLKVRTSAVIDRHRRWSIVDMIQS